ncbi:Lrp/AsnC family transcriptional regulator [Brevibacterium sp. RIT 803]|uniref:Lrp/AsnC family transcriptional regulator n=1 Tax=Brevibacterium sp. RIT 803 TaxID=2810210 RepID=UPI001952266A|nr:Lrp/AsnC family transcriptional regulator [Brevibacterium sp. RIT 803]MBM6588868.1 Lrp/AsnC family transcriptional regulator [Brevibacterium sp. RIT 803]
MNEIQSFATPEATSLRQDAAHILDSTDQKIVAALQLSPRASWARISEILNVSESVVLRRGRRLLSSGKVRVSALPDPLRCGFGFPVMIRLKCEIGSAQAVAQTLASRPDARLVIILAGSYDVLLELVVSTRAQLEDVLVDSFREIPGIVSSESATVIRTFKTSYDWGRRILGVEGDNLADSATPSPDGEMSRKLDSTDRRLIDLLSTDGRLKLKELSARSGISESSVRRRVDSLWNSKSIQFGTYVDPSLLGYEAPLMVWIQVGTERLESAAIQLSAIPEVRYVSATTGDYQLVAEVILKDIDRIYEFITSDVSALTHAQQTSIGLELRTVKRGYFPQQT